MFCDSSLMDISKRFEQAAGHTKPLIMQALLARDDEYVLRLVAG